MELIQDILPPGVLNVVSGFGLEAGKPLSESTRVAKVAFTGETSHNIIHMTIIVLITLDCIYVYLYI